MYQKNAEDGLLIECGWEGGKGKKRFINLNINFNFQINNYKYFLIRYLQQYLK